MRHIKTLAYLMLLAPLLLVEAAIADDAREGVLVSSLKVKERLQSIEQINVSAEKKQVKVEPESAAVAALLAEAETMDQNDREQAQAHSAAH